MSDKLVHAYGQVLLEVVYAMNNEQIYPHLSEIIRAITQEDLDAVVLRLAALQEGDIPSTPSIASSPGRGVAI